MQTDYFLYQSEVNEETMQLDSVKNVYSKIVDDNSKKIYVNRLLYSMTLETKYIRNFVLCTSVGQEFHRKINTIKKQPVLLYGAGKRGKQLVEVCPDVRWTGFIDEYQIGSFQGIKIKKMDEYSEISKSVIIVTNQMGYKEIETDLIKRGVEKTNIILLEEWNKRVSENQYYEKRCIQLENVEGFVDAGSFDGSDSLKLLRTIKNDACRVWAFEPDPKQYEACEKKLAEYLNVKSFNMGVSDEKKKVNMILLNNSGSFIDSINGEGIEVSIISLDELLLNEKVDYIKMDIEGSEEKALLGARGIIERQKPKLAVSIYHKRDDILRIPKRLLEFNPDYKFSFGHYSLGNVDSILYAF